LPPCPSSFSSAAMPPMLATPALKSAGIMTIFALGLILPMASMYFCPRK